MTEAIIHYNMGKNGNGGDNKFTLPPAKDLVKSAVVVGIFSYMNGVIINLVLNGKIKS
jgi:hypothetical protein